MRTMLWVGPWLVVGALAVSACGNATDENSGSGGTSGSAGTGGSAGQPGTEEPLGEPISDELVQRLCQVYTPCCEAAGYTNEHTVCEALMSSLLVADADAAEACAAATEEAAKADDWCETWYDLESPAVCDGAFAFPPPDPNQPDPATVGAKVGEPCETDFDCAADPRGEARCSIEGPDEPRVCQVLIDQQLGEPCVGERFSETGYFYDATDVGNEILLCELGLSCNAGTCAERKPLGGSCTSSQNCVEGLRCSAELICEEPLPLGASCEAAPGGCVEGTYCDFLGDQTCRVLKAGGEACERSMECASHWCSDSGVCDPETTDPGDGSDGGPDDGALATFFMCSEGTSSSE